MLTVHLKFPSKWDCSFNHPVPQVVLWGLLTISSWFLGYASDPICIRPQAELADGELVPDGGQDPLEAVAPAVRRVRRASRAEDEGTELVQRPD